MDKPERPPFTPLGAVFLVLVHFATFLGVAFLLGGMLSGSEEDTIAEPFMVGAAILAPMVALYVGLVRYAPDEQTVPALRLGRPDRAQWSGVALSFVAGAAIGPLLALIYRWILAGIPPEALEAEPTMTTATLILQVVGVLVIAPFAEEALFRGFIQPRLVAAVGVRRALMASVLLYFVAEVTVFSMLALPVGAATAVVALATGTTWAAVAAHLAMRASMIMWMILDVEPWFVAVTTVAAVGVLMLVWRRRAT